MQVRFVVEAFVAASFQLSGERQDQPLCHFSLLTMGPAVNLAIPSNTLTPFAFSSQRSPLLLTGSTNTYVHELFNVSVYAFERIVSILLTSLATFAPRYHNPLLKPSVQIEELHDEEGSHKLEESNEHAECRRGEGRFDDCEFRLEVAIIPRQLNNMTLYDWRECFSACMTGVVAASEVRRETLEVRRKWKEQFSACFKELRMVINARNKFNARYAWKPKIKNGKPTKGKKLVNSKAEERALNGYTGNWYGRMNGALRGQEIADDVVQEKIDNAIRALQKPYLPFFEGTVYRGVNQSFPKEGLIPGATFCDKAFLSSSTDPEINYGKGTGSTLFVIQCKTGKSVKRYSIRYTDEDEVLFAPNTLFRITSVTDRNNGGGLRVEMEEIPSWNNF
jgi:hypothetical protein